MDLAVGRDEIFVPPTKGGARSGAGRQPGSRTKNKTESDTASVPLILNRAEEKKYWRDALAKAVASDNVKEQREILQYINEMRRGKPYTATNPRERKQRNDDPRFLIAIQNLLPSSKRTSSTIDQERPRTIRQTRKRKPKALKP